MKILNYIAPPSKYEKGDPDSDHQGLQKIRTLLGDSFLDEIKGKTIIDFGCGFGHEALALADAGAKNVIGLDIRESVLQRARSVANQMGLSDRCSFVTETNEVADIVLSLDAFEHFDNPGEILDLMHRRLAPGGQAAVTFGYTWYHPLGGHLFSVFPWAHLIFSESALIRWRSQFKTDGATRFCEVEGGLNQMTIRRFERLVKESPLQFSRFELIPTRALKRLHNTVTREFTTTVVRCCLVSRVSDARSTVQTQASHKTASA